MGPAMSAALRFYGGVKYGIRYDLQLLPPIIQANVVYVRLIASSASCESANIASHPGGIGAGTLGSSVGFGGHTEVSLVGSGHAPPLVLRR